MNEQLQSATPCCITGKRDALVVARKDRHGFPLRTVIAKASGLVFTDPRPASSSIRDFYADNYRVQYKNTVVPKRKHILRSGRLALGRLRHMKSFLSGGQRILDVGSGGGEFVYLCNQQGYSARGIEPNHGYAHFSTNEYGIDVDCGFFQDARCDKESFDGVTLFHVLEHLEAPVSALTSLAEFLRPDGHLFVEVPNVNFTRTAPHQKWHVGHLYNFNPQTLAAVGVKAGLSPVNVHACPNDGVLFAVFRKTNVAADNEIERLLTGSFDATYSILKRHTLTRHYLNLHVPLGRLVTRLAANVNEQWVSRRYARPVEILNSLLDGSTRQSTKAMRQPTAIPRTYESAGTALTFKRS